MSTENFEYKNAMARLEEILSKIDNSEMEIDELAGHGTAAQVSPDPACDREKRAGGIGEPGR